MKKIVFLLPGKEHYPIGGYKIIYEYANLFSKNNYDITLVYPHIKYDFFKRKDVSLFLKIKTFIGFYYRLLRKEYTAGEWFNLDKRIKKRFVFVLNNFYLKVYKKNTLVISTSVETAYGLKLAKSIDNNNTFYFIQDFENWYENSDEYVNHSFSFPFHKIVISKWLKEVVEKTGNQAELIPNGLDFDYFKLSNPIEKRNPFEIAMLYHIDTRKRCCDSMKALEIVKKQFPLLHVSMFGVTDKPKELPDWYTYYKTPDKETHNLIYNTAAIFVAASEKEGWGLTPCEAMQCGAALACTNAGGFREFAINDNTALVSPVYDVEKLSQNIIELITDNSKRIRIAKNGYNYIQQFTWEKSFNKMKDYLEQFIDGE